MYLALEHPPKKNGWYFRYSCLGLDWGRFVLHLFSLRSHVGSKLEIQQRPLQKKSGARRDWSGQLQHIGGGTLCHLTGSQHGCCQRSQTCCYWEWLSPSSPVDQGRVLIFAPQINYALFCMCSVKLIRWRMDWLSLVCLLLIAVGCLTHYRL